MIAWSYSRLKTFEACPRKFFLLNISKEVKDTGSAAMDAGQRDHKALQAAVETGAPLPPHLASCEPVVAQLRGAKDAGRQVLTEQQWAFTRDFQPTGWFDKSVWVRVILDIAVIGTKTAWVGDYKTGKRDPDWDQLELFAASTFLTYPSVQTVHAQFLWTAHDTQDSEVFQRSQAPDIWGKFIPRVEKINEAEKTRIWEKRPARQCDWCPAKAQRKCDGK